MNKKTIIQVIVIVGAFGASAIVLYNGLFGSTPKALPHLTAAGAAGEEKILPFGDKFNYQLIDGMKAKNFNFGSVPYPAVNPTMEVGKDSIAQLIAPVPTTAPLAPMAKKTGK